ncbi:protein MpCYP822A1 [Marchantia polymorpha subsp. ruderalis]|uniref:Cytochrome P450 n=2 Tax=Marchantia polymorpha TaxID=3197 RepID=A0A176WJC2_MARPO|nr:hypothetical protein AXG93_3218s1280 [Marchantia polymorpha subsp. ruderalis]PTQ46813.1 hypothetical protein MARPO_0010s0184 [Marchantia polymorpha]BBN12766.1 hypothetical protein Mp_5g22720 [Marchantia polymorpha subsp. ruderalis]|eukprot:PTQ46813.1 hypothetical protein MARPO_0010s0184 [Marchantia polymorpha]
MENATFNSLKDSLVNQAWPDMWKPVLALVLLGIVSMKLFGGKSDGRRYPPGPKPLPFIGNMNLLFGDVLPKKLAEIAAQNKWPVMSFKLVNKQKVYVVSSPELTKEVLVTQGQTFASRSPPTFAQRYMVYGKDGKDTGVLFTHYSPTWRTNRKLMTVGQLQHRKIHGDAFIVDLLQVLYNELETKKGALSRNGEHPFEVRTLICRVFLLRIFLVFMFGPGAEKYGEELNALNDIMFYCLDMSEFAKWFFPHIEPLFDLYWGRYVTRKCMADKFRILKTILEDRSRYGGEKKWSFCDLLADSEKNGEISTDGSMHLLDEVIFAGQETTAKAIEGAIKELADRPDILKKIQAEMDEKIGKKQLRLEDVEKLPYFQAFIKECLRLHRTLTILVPHVNMEDTKLDGYDIPKGSSIWINVWAMAHNPEIFPDPFVLKPERFLNKEVGLAGEDPSYIVFGAGRRICPGSPLAMNCTHMIVGSLAQRYDIKFPSDWTKDKKTVFGFIPKERALEVCFTKREGF